MTYRKSLLTAAAIGFGVSVMATPVLAANSQPRAATPTNTAPTKVHPPHRDHQSHHHSGDPA